MLRVLSFGLLLFLLGASSATDHIIASFSNLQPGEGIRGWEPLRLGRAPETRYTTVRDEGTTVVRATASKSASGMIRRIRIDTDQTPILTWRWKIAGVIPNGNVTRRDGDDYPARIYVTFDYDPANLSFGDRVTYRALRALGYRELPVRAINYIWANRASETSPVPNPYTDWVQMIPVESGPSRAGQWRTETRDVAADYRRVFGEEPPPISGIAIMTDADNTEGAATAYYGDIRMRSR